MEIGEAIRQIRLEQGITLEAIAFAAGTDAANLSRIERGRQGFGPGMIERIAKALKLPVSAIYSRAEQELDSGDGIDDCVVDFSPQLERLNPKNQRLALEFVKMLLQLQETE